MSVIPLAHPFPHCHRRGETVAKALRKAAGADNTKPGTAEGTSSCVHDEATTSTTTSNSHLGDCHKLHNLQEKNKTLRVIKMNFVKQCLEMSAEIAELNDDYMESYEQFGKCLKHETHEDSTIRAKIAELLRLTTSKSEDEQLSLKEYVDRMKGKLIDLYYIIGMSIAVMSSSPVLGILRKKHNEGRIAHQQSPTRHLLPWTSTRTWHQ